MPPPFIGIWPRGSGKSTDAEAGGVEIGAQKKRNYCWYVRETQDQADKSVFNINQLLESGTIEQYYPLMSQRALSKYGKPKGWRRNRLVTAGGYTVDAMGLDTALRGIKVEENRPDLIILDDVDSRHDTIVTTTKKEQIITDSILPAGASNVAVLAIQNLMLPDGVFSRLVDGRADFLRNRVVSGPHPAVKNLAYTQKDGKFVVTGGEPTWPEGQGLNIVQDQINLWGISAFLREAQHEVEKTGGMYDHIEFQQVKWDEIPELVRTCVWVDPAVTSTDQSDSMGIQADMLGVDDIIYRLFSWEAITSPEDALKRAIRKAIELGSNTVGVETDQGGDTWKSVYARALEEVKREMKEELSEEAYNNIVWPVFRSAKAGAGHGSKAHRGQLMLADYERGKIKHVIGTHTVLEKALRRFPNKPLDLADAGYWSWADLRNRVSAEDLYAFI